MRDKSESAEMVRAAWGSIERRDYAKPLIVDDLVPPKRKRTPEQIDVTMASFLMQQNILTNREVLERMRGIE